MAGTYAPPFQRKAAFVATAFAVHVQNLFGGPTKTAEVVVPMSADMGASLVPDIRLAPERQPVQVSVSKMAWQLCGDTVVGLAHRRKGLPCQDAVVYQKLPRPVLVLSDGAGSAAISELGAQTLVIGISRFLRTLEDDLAPWLDEDDDTTLDRSTRWAEKLRLHAKGLLADLANMARRDVRDTRATLQVVVIGERNVFWWKVGDGAIVARSCRGLRTLGSQAHAKGEFANQTCFVDTASASEVQFGLMPTNDLVGIALMSDGGAERLVSTDGSRVANRVAEWLDDVARQTFTVDRIALAFHEPEMWERTSLDDRSIVLAARII